MASQGSHKNAGAGSAIALVMTIAVAACANQPPVAISPASNGGVSRMPSIEPGPVAAGTPVAPSTEKTGYVVIGPGQSLNGIAYSRHLSPAALAAVNHLTPPYKLKIGSRLVLPTGGSPQIDQTDASSRSPESPPPSSTDFIVIGPGQSLNGIAYSRHLSPAALAAVNHLTPPYRLKIGSRLRLPTAGGPRSNRTALATASPETPAAPRAPVPGAPSRANAGSPPQPNESRMRGEPAPSNAPPATPTSDPAATAANSDVATASSVVAALEQQAKTPFTKTIENGVVVYRGWRP